MHVMFLDLTHNSESTVQKNVHLAYLETARKTLIYLSCLPSDKRPKSSLLIRTFEALVKVGIGIIQNKILTARGSSHNKEGKNENLGKFQDAYLCRSKIES